MRVLLDEIDAPGVTLRVCDDTARIAGLAASIEKVGLLQPPGVVRDGARWRLVFGKGRLLAHRLLGRLEMEVHELTAAQASELAMGAVENIQRQDMTAVEEARALRAMIDGQGQTVREVAAGLGKSESWVRGRVEILTWPSEILELVQSGDLVPSVARELVLVEDPRVQAVYLRAAIDSGVTAAQARQWRQDWVAQGAWLSEQGGQVPVPGMDAAPPVPRMLCHGCAMDTFVTQLTIMRFCLRCSVCFQEGRLVPLGRAAEAGATG